MSIRTNDLVAAEIRAEMARKQRRQSDLVEVLGISQSGVSSRLHGRVDLTVDEVVAIAGFLEVDPAKWLAVAS